MWHTDAVYHALKARSDIKPDLIVGHSGFGSTLFLPELYPNAPIVNLFEYYYMPHMADSDTSAAQLGITRATPIVVYCTGGVRSSYAWAILRASGFTNVRNFDGSFFQWAKDKRLPIVTH